MRSFVPTDDETACVKHRLEYEMIETRAMRRRDATIVAQDALHRNATAIDALTQSRDAD